MTLQKEAVYVLGLHQETCLSLPCCMLVNASVPEGGTSRGSVQAAAADVPEQAPEQSSDLQRPEGPAVQREGHACPAGRPGPLLTTASTAQPLLSLQ